MNALDGVSVALVLMTVGCLLVMAEVFFPSGGLLGVLSAAAFFGAIYSAYTAGGITYGLGCAAAETLLLPLMLYVSFTYLPRTPMGKLLVGRAPTAEEVLPEDNHAELVGKTGVARSRMLPSGVIEIEGRQFDAVSQGQAIDTGDPVTVVEANRTRVVVRRAKPSETPSQAAEDPDPLARPAGDLGLEDFDFEGPSADARTE